MPITQDGQAIRSSEAYSDAEDNTQAEISPASLREDLNMIRTVLRLIIDPTGSWFDTPAIPLSIIALVAIPFACTATEQPNDLVYVNANDNVRQGDASDPAKADVIGWIVSKPDAVSCLVFTGPGPVGGAAGLTAGTKLFLDPANPGKVTEDEPEDPDVIVEVGFAKNATEFVFSKGAVL